MIFWTEWIPLTPASVENLSDVSGLYEVKVLRRLVDYPTGRSAMIYYGKTLPDSPSLRRTVAADWFAPEKEPIRVRWQEYGEIVFRWAATGRVDEEQERRLRLFRERFGRVPWGNPE